MVIALMVAEIAAMAAGAVVVDVMRLDAARAVAIEMSYLNRARYPLGDLSLGH
jgi:hypothetical protein